MSLERLAVMMQNNVHRVDGKFPFEVHYYDGSDTDVVEEGVDVYYRDSVGNDSNIWIESIERVGDDGIIHCKDHTGEPVEVEIFERVNKIALAANGLTHES